MQYFLKYKVSFMLMWQKIQKEEKIILICLKFLKYNTSSVTWLLSQLQAAARFFDFTRYTYFCPLFTKRFYQLPTKSKIFGNDNVFREQRRLCPKSNLFRLLLRSRLSLKFGHFNLTSFFETLFPFLLIDIQSKNESNW